MMTISNVSSNSGILCTADMNHSLEGTVYYSTLNVCMRPGRVPFFPDLFTSLPL